MATAPPPGKSDIPRDAQEAYQRPAEKVLAALGSDAQRGLSASEAAERGRRYGPNALEARRPTPAWRRFLAQFKDVLVIMLLVAAALSFVQWLIQPTTPLPYQAIVILAIELLNATLGYVQEVRAEQAVAALRAMAAAEATVLRDGARQRIPAAELVPGDLLLVNEGDTIPADARLLEAHALQMQEASLTGESEPVAKDGGLIEREVPLGDRRNMLFSGTAAVRGRGTVVVTATGSRTEMGHIAGMLEVAQAEVTPLQKELDRTGKLLAAIVVAITGVVVGSILLVYQVRDPAALANVLLFGVALAVAAVPEGLPAVVTAVLAVGVQRMARRKAIVRKLPAIETLGSATVIASDKTGTLTKNEMTVRALLTASGRIDLTGEGYLPEGELQHEGQPLRDERLRAEAESALRAAALANDATLTRRDGEWHLEGDPTEGALLVAACKAGLDPQELAQRFERVGEVPFSSERKQMSAAHREAERREGLLLSTKGAPDVLLGRCSHELVGSEARPLSDERREQIRAANDQLTREALRTLGLACRALPGAAGVDGVDERVEAELVFLGLVGMLDPPRAEVKEAIARAAGAGIRTIMITGDHPNTGAAIAGELEISPKADRGVITGAKLDELDDAQLDQAVREAAVYARVNPGHKLRIVEALQRTDEVVAVTGDGVNDAPALKQADIGVAMGMAGTDVAREAADMVLTDDNYATIVAAIEEGRAVYANIQKFLRYLLSSNMGEILTIFVGVMVAGAAGLEAVTGGPNGQSSAVLALLATQLLWINLITDGPPALALGLDPTDPAVMRRPPRERGRGVIGWGMWLGILFVGLIMAAGTLLAFDAGLPGGLIDGAGELPYAQTLGFTTLVLFQLFNAFNARSEEASAFRHLLANRWLWGAVALSLLLQAAVVYLPFLQAAFGTVSLGLRDWLFCTVVASSVFWLREASKLLVRQTPGRGRPSGRVSAPQWADRAA